MAPGTVTACTLLRGNFRQPCGFQPIGISPGAGAPRAIEAQHGAIGLADEDEAVAADAGHVRLGEAENGRGGDGRINRIAALAQHINGGKGGQRRRGGGHAVGAEGQRTSRLVEISHTLYPFSLAAKTAAKLSQAASHCGDLYCKKARKLLLPQFGTPANGWTF